LIAGVTRSAVSAAALGSATFVVLSWEGTAVAGITTAIKEKGLVGKVVGVVNDMEVVAGLKDGTLYGTSRRKSAK
jgi:ABC-type sugar transport system substrate-binding protein